MSAFAQPSPGHRSFAGMLADIASPEKKFPPARDLDGLAEDIATLTYEHALKTHARYRPSSDHALSPEAQPSQPAFPASLPLFDSSPASADLPQRTAPLSAQASSLCTDAAGRKSASVTVRLTRAENDQLRQRAGEAGLTISAYLRSCAFEVESLRTQVKQTIAEMRHTEPTPAQSPQHQSRLTRLFSWKKRSAA
ncbi:plasmid mobilization protein [Occallatibacter riparius]|uniref:Uncharacterized protein n=1 Tax=Occallatibacter riparius TaxID=1002689 RepID=A0A9J7BP64_9BACT|nr:hypothetical protein [Occallatibacter riparius]UWZ84676.1 hypothetical protein MOP44_01775 [Occallatibacter riparius]